MGALAEEGVIITLQTMLKRHVFKNYDVFKVFHWDWDLQNILTQLTKNLQSASSGFRNFHQLYFVYFKLTCGPLYYSIH